MKRILPLILLLSLTACSSLIVKRTPELIRDAQTNIVQVVVTNTVQREVWTTNRVELPNGAIQIQPVREIFAERVTYTNMLVSIAPAVWYTNLSLAPTASGAVQVAGELAPVPWGGIVAQGITALAGLVFAGYNWFGKRRAEKEAGVQADLAETSHSAAVAVVKGLQEVREVALKIPGYTDKIDANVMKVVRGIQLAAGPEVKAEVAAIVDEHTEPLSKSDVITV